MPSASSCGDFQFKIATQTASNIFGTITAVCGGALTIAGNASGLINGTTVAVTATGTANMPGVSNCAFSLSGTGTIEDNTLRVPFTGTTCRGR